MDTDAPIIRVKIDKRSIVYKECRVANAEHIITKPPSHPPSLRPLSLMNFITKKQGPKPLADSRPWVTSDRHRNAKRPKFKDKDLKRLSEFDITFGLNPYNLGWSASYGGAYIENEDDTGSFYSFSTNATMDNIPGTGRTIDMYFYQPVGHAIEKFALKIAIRLNNCHPSPAQILRFLRLGALGMTWHSVVQKPGDVIDRISVRLPSAVPGILSLVQQSQ